ncbi:hypothetical protein VK792_17135 [Mesobacterium sp. TK19101]|uniref:Uncharacterized protein n=1 Tax=Mesobacterium hydrothermale TaxID=3111907 RepID=A0ABU6HKZ2_9RHOB|nr:hypothetical protein [Mesobacterium sp. TK19101]MEC3863021.1 hypothetical protein [Mesobacterium sp. TK19101]
MGDELPDYYFRTRENGAAVFRVDSRNRMRRIEMEQIAVVNIRNGEIRPHGKTALSAADEAAIGDWMAARAEVLAARELDDMRRLVDQVHAATIWAQGRAGAAELAAVTDDLLLALHDLRAVLVRKKAERGAADKT